MAKTEHCSFKTTTDRIKDQGENISLISLDSDSNHLLKYLPEEVWYRLSNKLGDTTIQNLQNSTPFFRNLCLSKRTNFLYQSVIQTILPKLPTNDQKSFLLSNRFICKTWNQKICILTSRLWEERRTNLIEGPHLSIPPINYWFKNSQVIDKFLKFFNATHPTTKNPFVGRSILIDFRYLDSILNPAEFFAATSQLLTKYGTHIHNCEILLARMPHEIPEILQELLCLLPNLKCLNLSNFPADQQNNFSSDFQTSWGLNISNFRNLKCLRLRALPRFMVNRIFEISSSTISSLQIRPIPNFSENSSIIFLSSPNTKWFLRKLHIQFFHGVSLYQILKQIENSFRESLQHFCLDLPSNQAIQSELELRKLLCDSKHYRLDLPKVTKVELTVMNDTGYSLNFILGLAKTLEELSINIHENGISWNKIRRKGDLYLDEGQEIIEWVGCQERMYQSNIWKLFPKLKRITCGKSPPFFNKSQRIYGRVGWAKERKFTKI